MAATTPEPAVVARGHGSAIIVPDAGPLITLAKANLLSLLLLPRLPVWVVDQVVHEVTSNRAHPDAVVVADFLAAHPGPVRVFETEVGRLAARQRSEGFIGRQRGLGEAAIAEFVARLDEVVTDPAAPAIVIFEDADVRAERFRPGQRTRLVSTMTYVRGLAEMDLIPSFTATWAAIKATGRSVPAVEVDHPPTGATWRRRGP